MTRLLARGCVTLEKLEDPTAVFEIFGDKRQLVVADEADHDLELLCGALTSVVTVGKYAT